MKVVLVKHGNTLKPESGNLPVDWPARITVEVPDHDSKPVELWYPIFPPGSQQLAEEAIRQEAGHGGKRR